MAKKMGRPPKCTPERVEKICQALENGESIEMAAKLAGITKPTYYDWLEKNLDFSNRVKEAKARFEDWQLHGILEDARKSLKTLICGLEYDETKTEYEPDKSGSPRIKKQTTVTKKILPNATAVIFALCNRDPENWSNRHIQELTGRIETESKPNIPLDKIPDELLAQVIESMSK